MIDAKLERLCLSLINVDSEESVIELLRTAGFWENEEVWRDFGDLENNFSTIGNQANRPETALAEKLVNSVDAQLTMRCHEEDIDPEGDSAPQSSREAVAMFFAPWNPNSVRAGYINEWSDEHRRKIARGISLAVTGSSPSEGNPSITIADSGEGQVPREFPNTFLSLHRSNKLRIPFVQGKFNMGGTGSLRFCSEQYNLQLVVSRRNQKLVKSDEKSDKNWGFTIVRRRTPENSKNTVYEYLAPQGAEDSPREGEVLSFFSSSLPIFPKGREPYHRCSDWGTLIKLYEYQINRKSNILRKDGLLYRLDLILPDIALPIRLHECRKSYRGHEGSFDNNLTGFRVRLDDNRAENLEFDPTSSSLMVAGQQFNATIYAFKKNKAETYRNDEGILFTVNGQTHGFISTDFFRRKAVGLSYLRDSILVVVDCSRINSRNREDLFMNSRDRLADCDLRRQIERQMESLLKNDSALRDLKERRRREEVESIVSEDKPLEQVLRNLISKSPNLSSLFLKGERLSNPFRPQHVEEGIESFSGKKHPTYFRFKGKDQNTSLMRDAHINQRCRIAFETDVECGYFSRDIDRGDFKLVYNDTEIVDDYLLNLQNGIANLTIRLPEKCTKGDKLSYSAITNDRTLLNPFVNQFELSIVGKSNLSGGNGTRRKPPGSNPGQDRENPSGLNLPNITEVTEEKWNTYSPAFDKFTAIRVMNAGVDKGEDVYDFFVNMDNIYLQNHLKSETRVDGEGANLVRAQFKYGLVLIGIALLKPEVERKESANRNSPSDASEDEISSEEIVERYSSAVAAVLIPVINSLGELNIEEDVVHN